jgi:hypothetical protein
MKKWIVLVCVALTAIANCQTTHTFPALDTNNAFTGTNSFSNTTTLTGVALSCKPNSVLYVGGAITCWSGTDIGAQINAAYATLPTAGGQIVVLPPTGGGCYSYSTPITFTTTGKFIILQGAAPNQSTTGPAGVCLNYTPTTATKAITFDIDQTGVGSGNAMGAGMRDITLVGGSLCNTNGGCGGSAVGISTGTNGCGACLFLNDSIEGFNEGFAVTDTYGWGIHWLNTAIIWNGTGIYYNVPSGHELDKFIGGILNDNGTGVALSTAELSIVSTSLDSNMTCGVSIGNRGSLHTTAVHWENNPPGTFSPVYVCSASTSSVLDMSGGVALDDGTTGSYANPWFTAGIIHADGVYVSSDGRASTGSIFSANTDFAGINVTAIPQADLTPLVNNVSVAVFTMGGDGSTVPEVNMPAARFPLRAAPGDIQTSGFANCYGDSTANALLCSNNNDTPSQVTRFVNNGPVYNHSGSAVTSPHTVRDFCTLGTSCAVVFTGSSIYTSSNSFVCVASDKTGANPVQVTYPSDGAHVTFTGTGADNLAYICVGG